MEKMRHQSLISIKYKCVKLAFTLVRIKKTHCRSSLTIFDVFQRPTFKWYFTLLNMRRGREQFISTAYMFIAAYELYTMLQINMIHSTESYA